MIRYHTTTKIENGKVIQVDIPFTIEEELESDIREKEWRDGEALRKATQIRNDAKLIRQKIIDSIKVSVGNKVFDGNEISQSRMTSAILMMQISNQKTIKWTLADNTTKEITLDELKQALSLAVKEKSKYWEI